MKLKCVLSAVLALALLAAFGMQGAAAREAPPAIALSQSGSWQQAEFRWAVPEDAAAFFAAVDDGTIAYRWNVSRASRGNLRYVVNELRQEDMLVLSIMTSRPGFTTYQVSLTVNGQTSEQHEVWLFNDAGLQALIAQANRLAQNRSRRHCAEYIAQLQTAIAAAQALYATDEAVTQSDITTAVDALRGLVAAPELARTSNNFVNRFIPNWWRFVDFVATPFRWLQDRADFVFSMAGQIFTAMLSL